MPDPAGTARPPTQDLESAETDIGSQPVPQRNSISSFIFVTFVLFMLTNNGGDDFVVKNRYKESLRSLQYQQSNFSAWINGTTSNFTLPEHDRAEMSLVESIMSLDMPLNLERASYYRNITGFIHGPSEFYNLSSFVTVSPETPHSISFSSNLAGDYVSNLNLTEAIERIGVWNWTACDKVSMRVLEKKPVFNQRQPGPDDATDLDDISLIQGKLDLVDSRTGEELPFDVEAVHFLSNGSIYGFAEPTGRHVDPRFLPSLVPAVHMTTIGMAVEADMYSRIARLQAMVDAGTVETDSPYVEETPKTTCPFTLYGQLVPTDVPAYLMQELESELERPTGINTARRPDLKISGVLTSKECGILYYIKDAEGLKSQRFWRKVTTYSGIATCIYLTLLILLSRQTAASRTPAGLSRISRWSFFTQAAADSLSFVGHITFGVLAHGRPSLSLIAPAFLACVLLVYEAQFSALIHQVQAPEETSHTPPPRPPPPPTSVPSPPSTTGEANNNTSSNVTPAGTPTLPIATPTAPSGPPARSFIATIWAQVLSSPQVRLWFTIALLASVIVHILVSPSLALLVIGFIYSMFWVPQIIRSARRGTAGGLRKEYLIGTTICRAYFVLYVFACPKNVLEVKTSRWIYLIVVFLVLQVTILLLQEYLGPTFFLPSSYVTISTYDYHPAIPVPDSEAPDHSLGDCAICMDAIVAHPSRRRSLSEKSQQQSRGREKERSGAGAILGAVQMGIEAAGRGASGAKKSWAVAPCHHIFHTACLERWLDIKNICPQCRRPLPPL